MRVQRHRYRSKKTSKMGRKLGSFAFLLTLLGFPLLIFSLLAIFWFATTKLPSVSDAQQLNFAQSTIIYDRKALEENANLPEHTLYIIHGDENRNYVPIEKMSPWVEKATLAIEDDNFYSHWGFDIGGLVKAVVSELGIGPRRGGSTITQQLIKNTFLNNERTWTRKFKEILLSVKMEQNYEKKDILELYLNKIPYGNNAYGIEAAAQTYFAKSAKDLTLAEASILVSLPVAPTRFNPYGDNKQILLGYDDNGEWKKGRKDLVLERMVTLGVISEEEMLAARAEASEIVFKRAVEDIKAPHFVMHVKKMVAEKYGEELIETGGLKIFTTIHPQMQKAAEEVIKERTKDYYNGFRASNAALGAINPENGEVLAYVGGKDYFSDDFDGQVDVLQSFRQPGSSMKPFVYGAAFENKFTPATVMFDVETDFGDDYKPQNYNGKFTGPVRARVALNKSLNVPAVKMAYAAGGDKKVVAYSQKTGMKFADPEGDHGVAIGVGSAEVQPMSLVAGYQSFVNEGASFIPQYILEIHDTEGNVLEKYNAEENKLVGVPNAGAALVRNILTDEKSRPSGWNKYLQLPDLNNGAKTGTSNRGDEPSDSWTVGFTPHLVSGVWVGNNSGRTMVGGATGLAMAAPIWRDFNVRAHSLMINEGADSEKGYPTTLDLVPRTVNKYSGELATEKTPSFLQVTEYFAPENVIKKADSSIIATEIDIISGKEATDATPEYLREASQKLALQSIFPKKNTWQTPAQNWMTTNTAFVLSLGKNTGALQVADRRELDAKYAEAELAHLRETDPFGDLYDDQEKLAFPDYDGEKAAEPAETSNTNANVSLPTFGSDTTDSLSIKLVSPRENAEIENPNMIVKLSPRAQNGVESVVIFVNNTPVKQMKAEPWLTTLNVTDQMIKGHPFQLRAVLTDKKGNVTEEKVRLRPDKSWKPPRTSQLDFEG